MNAVGSSELLARRLAEDERLLEEFARGRTRQDVERARGWVRHVRQDIGPYGVITKVEVKPDEVIGWYYMEEPEPPSFASLTRPASLAQVPRVAAQPGASAASDSLDRSDQGAVGARSAGYLPGTQVHPSTGEHGP